MFAVVRLASLDVRRRPDHAAEMGSQLLMGESVRLLRRGAGGRWQRVENLSDGYCGWVRTWGLWAMPLARLAAWRRRALGRPARPWIEVRESPGGGSLVTPLFWGARVIPGRIQGRFRQVELPDGNRGWVAARELDVRRRSAPPLAARVRDLLGVPYLWGGRTPAGMDCSGLVQMVLAERGIMLPRDAADQERSSRRLKPGERARIGDLVFFGPPRRPAGHVGLMLGRGAYVHARGQVRINHLDPVNTLFDSELWNQFRGIRRPLCGRVRPA